MSKCSKCNKEIGLFSREYRCADCGNIFCGDCISQVKKSDNDMYVSIISCLSQYNNDCCSGWSGNYRLCPDCMKKFNSRYGLLEIADISTVRTYSVNYLGKKPHSDNYKEYETQFYDNREDAILEIKKCARLLKSNTIVDLSFSKDTGQSGNYKHTIWSASGKILM